MVSQTMAALVVMTFAVFAYDHPVAAAEASANKAQDEPGIKHEAWDKLLTKDFGSSVQKNMHLRNKALPAHFTGFAQSAAGTPANLVSIVQKQRQQAVEHVLDSKKSSSKCDDGDKFSIEASAAPLIEGCYEDIGIDLWGESVYSQNGKDETGQTIVMAYKSDESSSMISPDEPLDLWLVIYSVSKTEAYAYCASIDTASETHPSDVKTWYCDLKLKGEYEEAEEDDFALDCGCE